MSRKLGRSLVTRMGWGGGGGGGYRKGVSRVLPLTNIIKVGGYGGAENKLSQLKEDHNIEV